MKRSTAESLMRKCLEMEREMAQNQAEQGKKYEQRAQTKDAFSQFVAAKNEFKMSLAQLKKKPKRLRRPMPGRAKLAVTGRSLLTVNKEGQMVQMPYRPMQRPAVRTISFAQLCSMSRAGMADEVFRRRAEMEFALNEFKMQRIAMMNSRHADMTL